MNAIRLSLKSMIRRARATVLVMFPVALLFALLTFLVATEAAMAQLMGGGYTTRALRLGSVRGVSAEKGFYSEAEINRIKPPGVTLAPGNFGNCYTDVNEPREFICGVTNRTYVEIWDQDQHVPPEEIDHWERVKNGIIITRTMAAKHHWKVGDTITLYSKFAIPVGATEPAPMRYEITYISDQFLTENKTYIHIAFWEQFTGKANLYWVVWMLCDKAEDRQGIMDKLHAELNAIHRPHQLWTMEESKQMIAGASGLLRGAFSIAGAFSFLLVLCVALTLLILSIEQRNTELATLRAIGFRRGVLAWSVVLEGVLTLLPGAALGAASMWFMFHDHPVMFDLIFKVKVTWEVAVASAIGGALLGAFAAIIPAWRVYRLDVLSSLR